MAYDIGRPQAGEQSPLKGASGTKIKTGREPLSRYLVSVKAYPPPHFLMVPRNFGVITIFCEGPYTDERQEGNSPWSSDRKRIDLPGVVLVWETWFPKTLISWFIVLWTYIMTCNFGFCLSVCSRGQACL